ncbi:MAG: TorF family putative porin [Pseudomonadota bacterium]
MAVHKQEAKYTCLAFVSAPIVCALGTLLFCTQAAADVTGHFDLTSKYVLRGITTTYGPTLPGVGNQGGDAPENNKTALQMGLDYSNTSGFYAGWWASTLGYSYQSFNDAGTSMEHDLYGGYQGKAGDVGYKLGLTRYQYIPGFHSTALETMIGLTYKEFGANMQTLLDDVTFGNKGDTYYTVTYNTPLPKDFAFNASLGYYTYKKVGPYTNPGASPLAVSSAFRHLNLGMTYPLAKSVTAGATYIIGGKNRYDVKQDNQLLANISYMF